ncbi:MAG: hypothetical protein ACAH11_08210 [Sphingomonas sp.]
MKTRFYLLIAFLAFIASVTISDLIARMTIGGDSLATAFIEHAQWDWETAIGVLLLLIPFAGVALICAAANQRVRTRSAVAIFGVSLAILAYFYFDGFQAAQQAMVQERWTAATLSIGLLPFFIGLPLLAVTVVAAVVAMSVDRRPAV